MSLGFLVPTPASKSHAPVAPTPASLSAVPNVDAGAGSALPSWVQAAGAVSACAFLARASGRSGRRSQTSIVRNAAEAEAEEPKAEEPEAPPKPAWDPASEVGAMAPLGFFDPAGFTKKDDKAGFNNLRAAEVKHGRVAMMAAVGAVAQHFIKFPGFDGVPSGLSAVTTPPGTYGFALLFIVAGALELGVWTESPDKEPGNFGDPAGLGMYDTEMRNREINNGRFAMFAALGIISAELLTGKDAVSQLS